MSIGLFLAATVLSVAAAVLPGAAAAFAAIQDRVDFARDIQPILQTSCYKCNSQDSNDRRA